MTMGNSDDENGEICLTENIYTFFFFISTLSCVTIVPENISIQPKSSLPSSP